MTNRLPALAFVLAALAAAVAADAPYQDIKGDAMRVYGVRGAYDAPDGAIRVVLGACCTGAMGDARCWRIVSDDDPAYAYDKFIAPKSAKVVASEDEFSFPAGFKAPGGAGVPLKRSVVDLIPPTPLKPGCEYAVIGQGNGNSVLTLAVPAATFVSGKSSEKLPADSLAAQISGLRRLSSVGDGKLLAEFGQGFNTDAGNVLANYRVTVNGKETPVAAFGRRTIVDAYQPDGWPFRVLRKHDLFLDIGQTLKKGDKVALSVAGNVTCGAREASFTFDTATSYTRSIQVNQNGYLPAAVKVAYLGCWFGSFPDPNAVGKATTEKKASSAENSSLAPYALAFAEPPEFHVVDAASGAVAWRGKAKFTHNGLENDGRANNSAANVYELDFSAFRKPGRYYLAIDGVGRSFSFDIGADVYQKAFGVASLGVFAQRCGIAFDRKTGDLDWNRLACHTDGITVTDIPRYTVGGNGHTAKFRDHIVYVPDKTNPDATIPLVLQASGGHHDAGDYNPRSHIDVARSLLSAYELAPKAFTDGQLRVTPAERKNGIPDIVDEALWAVKLWAGLQDPADGGVYDGTESQGDPAIYQTVEMDPCGDFCFAKDSKASFEAAAIFAQASRILASFPGQEKRAANLLARARKAYAWGVANKPDIQDPATLGTYTVSSRAYAAAELFHTTGEEAFHKDFKDTCPWIANPKAEIDVWTKYDMKSAAYSYTRIPREKADPKLWDDVLAAIRAKADMTIAGSDKMAYKFLRDPWAPISWGTGAYENYSLPVAHIWRITGEPKYRDWLIRTCDNTLGANPLNLSWIVGIGTETIRMPLHNSRHRPAGFAVVGQQAQGPNQRAEGYHVKDTLYPAHRDAFACLHCFVDGIFAIAMDEGTVNNQANTMAVFGLLCAEP